MGNSDVHLRIDSPQQELHLPRREESYTSLKKRYLDAPRFSVERHAILRSITDHSIGIFKSKFEREPHRTLFLELPGEVRNMIYDYALFHDCDSREWNLRLRFPDNRLEPAIFPAVLANTYDVKQFRRLVTISTLRTLGTVSKQIRHEARTFFWSMLEIKLVSGHLDHHEAVYQFLTIVGRDCAASMTTLINWKLRYNDASLMSFHAFQGLLGKVLFCINLRKISFNLQISNVYRGDLDALRALFLYGQGFQSPSLEVFANTLVSLKRLETVHIGISNAWCDYSDIRWDVWTSDIFYCFAFSGIRRHLLWSKLFDRLQASPDGHQGPLRKFNKKVTVWMTPPSHRSFLFLSETLCYNKFEQGFHRLRDLCGGADGLEGP